MEQDAAGVWGRASFPWLLAEPGAGRPDGVVQSGNFVRYSATRMPCRSSVNTSIWSRSCRCKGPSRAAFFLPAFSRVCPASQGRVRRVPTQLSTYSVRRQFFDPTIPPASYLGSIQDFVFAFNAQAGLSFLHLIIMARKFAGKINLAFCFHFPFSNCHFSFFSAMREPAAWQWKMKNDNWKMENGAREST
jgi:hypothetical protein